MSDPRRVRVVKVGGSLLDLPDLGSRLSRWLEAQPCAVNLVVAGGGELADVVRRLDQRFHLDPEQAHRLAVATMAINAEILTRLLPDSHLVLDMLAAVGQAASGDCLICDLGRKPSPAKLPWWDAAPPSWDATSDSLAAYLAHHVQAEELVLLKSTSVPIGASLQELADCDYVDRDFPKVAEDLLVRFECLRDE